MSKNISVIDKFVRLFLGFLVMVMGLNNQSWWGLLGLLPVATVLYMHCPIYTALGFDAKA